MIKNIRIFDPLKKYVSKINPFQSVLFFDIDNTLLRLQGNIGTPEWISWQEKMITNTNGRHPFCVASNHKEMYLIYQKWMNSTQCSSIPMDETLGEWLSDCQYQGHKIVLITARGYDVRDITFHQFNSNYKNIPLYLDKEEFGLDDCQFYHGIYFASGKNKGLCVKELLDLMDKKMNFNPSSVIFVDDSKKECENVVNNINKLPLDLVVFNYNPNKSYQNHFDSVDKTSFANQWNLWLENQLIKE